MGNSNITRLVTSEPSESLIRFAEGVVEYLRTRYHTEKPHIGVLIPMQHKIVRELLKVKRGLIEGLEEEFSLEDVEEMLDPTTSVGKSVFGVTATFKNWKEDSSATWKCSFYFRVAPPCEFRRVEIESTVRNSSLEVSFNIYEDGKLISSASGKCETFMRDSAVVVVPIGHKAIERLKRTFEKLRGVKLQMLHVSDHIFDALCTKASTNSGKVFSFWPNVEGSNRPPTSDKYRVIQNVLLEFSGRRLDNDTVELTFLLWYVAPIMLEGNDVVPVVGYGYPLYAYIDDRRERWSVHHLLEVEGKLSWSNCDKGWNWKKHVYGRDIVGLHGLLPKGCLAVDSGSNDLLLRDWHIHTEQVPKIKSSSKGLRASLIQSIAKAFGELTDSMKKSGEIVENALRQVGITSLYTFQEESLARCLHYLLKGGGGTIVLNARAASGKTLAFLLPLLIYMIHERLSGTVRKGVRAILMYPTIALQNDQATNIVQLLWHTNKQLPGEPISIGILHSYTPKRRERRPGDKDELRLLCPSCRMARLVINWEVMQGCDASCEVVACSRSECELSHKGTHGYELLQRTIRASRDAIYSDPPDILIASPDILNARLTLMGNEDPSALSIIGKSVLVCRNCGNIHEGAKSRKCDRCKHMMKQAKYTHPLAIVIDEAHLLRGAFGAQVAHLITRLVEAIIRINNLPEDWRPVYVISSATLNDPKDIAAKLLSIKEGAVKVITAEPDPGEQRTLKVHVFIMPSAYSPEATAARITEAVFSDEYPALHKGYSDLRSELVKRRRDVFGDKTPSMLVFAETVPEVNQLLGLIRVYLPGVRVDGHSTDWHKDRPKVEDEFSRGELDALVATKGLEVGVDFERINVGMIFGMPFYISDYTQRIGRPGRNRDCLIFNIFMPDRPVDHFFYRNWRLLCDGGLRELQIRAEAYRINRENSEALKRSARRAVLDFISIQPRAEQLLKRQTNCIAHLRNELRRYVRDSLDIDEKEQEVLEVAINFFDTLVQQQTSLRRAIKELSEDYKQSLRGIRSIEAEVRYEYSGYGERRRELLYAFRHCIPGQVITYRGIAFVVNMVEGDSKYVS